MIDDNDDDDEYEWVVPDGGKIYLFCYQETINLLNNMFLRMGLACVVWSYAC